MITTLQGRTQKVEISPEGPTVIIGERLNQKRGLGLNKAGGYQPDRAGICNYQQQLPGYGHLVWGERSHCQPSRQGDGGDHPSR